MTHDCREREREREQRPQGLPEIEDRNVRE